MVSLTSFVRLGSNGGIGVEWLLRDTGFNPEDRLKNSLFIVNCSAPLPLTQGLPLCITCSQAHDSFSAYLLNTLVKLRKANDGFSSFFLVMHKQWQA